MGYRISQLEEGITNISNDIKVFNAHCITNESSSFPQVEFPIRRESEELVEIARTLVSNASSVMASESAQSTPSTVRDLASYPEDTRATPQQENSGVAKHANTDDSGQEASYSVIGITTSYNTTANEN